MPNTIQVSIVEREINGNFEIDIKAVIGPTTWDRIGKVLSARGLTRDDFLAGGGWNPARQSAVLRALADGVMLGG